MGFFKSAFKSVGRFAGGCAEKVGKATRWDSLEKAGKKLKDICQEEIEDTSKRTSEEDSYDEMAATIAETKRMNNILSEFSLKLSDYADDLEENAINESSVYFDELVEYLKIDKDENCLNINISKIKRNKIKVEKQIRGSFKNYLAKRVSLDDSECLSILKLDAGPQKKTSMNKFGNKVLKEAANNLCLDIKESLLDQQEYIEACLDEKMEDIINIQYEMIDKFSELEEAYSNGKSEIDEKKFEILSKIAICELALITIKD